MQTIKEQTFGGDTAWYAVRVRSRHEEQVAAALTQKGYEILLPQYTCRKQWSDRVKACTLPLFPGYLFSRLDIANRGPLVITPGVMQIIGAGQTFVPVDPDEIESIRRVVASGVAAEPLDYLRVGQRVRIAAGPLRGVEGILARVNDRRRLVLSVSLRPRSVSVEIDPSQALPVDEAERVIGFGAWQPQLATA
jgi:transcriptional antiterminator RfaH